MISRPKYIPKPGAKVTPLQSLASHRNWSRLQIKGSVNQLAHQIYQSNLSESNKGELHLRLRELEKALLFSVDKKWTAGKIKVVKDIANEAFNGVEAVVQEPQDHLTTWAKKLMAIREAKGKGSPEWAEAKLAYERDMIKKGQEEF